MTTVEIFNTVMFAGIVLMIIAIRQLEQDNKVLREKNERERARNEKLFGLHTTETE